jgi:hypothetical protein
MKITLSEFNSRVENLSQRLHALTEEKPLNLVEVMYLIGGEYSDLFLEVEFQKGELAD